MHRERQERQDMGNRLANALSPYLRQHADNPVDWHEWGSAAFAEARRRDVPVFLSVGYAACHWCHVMAHESFEDHEVARVLAEGYVSVKVDREERPDIDAVYMAATSALTGQGGWPMTCLLTPSAEPFFAGTYLTKDQLLGLLTHAGELWRTSRPDLESSSRTITERLREVTAAPTPALVGPDQLAEAVTVLRRSFDTARGGFGRSPKFPPSMVLEMLSRHTARTGSPAAAEMLDQTLLAMAAGGIHDQLAGGFARYAVDAAWVVPHFEKMLYDNALLARVYGHRAAATGDARLRQVALDSAEFIVRDLGTPEGGFAAALDADTLVEGVLREGATYVWSPAQLAEVLGLQDGARAAQLLSVTPEGTFEHSGGSTLQLRTPPPDPSWWESLRERLLAARNTRPQPARDDKVVTAWAGLAVAALSELGVLFERPGLLSAARSCAELVLQTHVVDGRLRRTSLAGEVSSAPAVLADYGNLADGLVALHLATGEPQWLTEARTLLDLAVEHFHDDDGWHDTADDAEPLVLRPQEDGDNAEPSGRSAIAAGLLAYAMAASSLSHLDLARDAVAAAGTRATSQPRFAGWSLAVAETLAAGPLQVAVVGDGPSRDELAALARALVAGRGVVAVGAPDDLDQPLLADRPVPEGAPAAAYICVGTTCSLPLTDSAALRDALSQAQPSG